MAKVRTTVPKQVQESVLREFNHRCSVCGADRPQVHHIDEDPSNNAPGNLLPLCPNCHLTDQHDPTRRFDVAKLQLFRRYKDPTILSPQFHPLFLRMRFLLDLSAENRSRQLLRAAAKDLEGFVRELEMGSYYADRIATLTKLPNRVGGVSLSALQRGQAVRRSDASIEAESRRDREALAAVRDEVIELAVELLRYQAWPSPAARRHP